MSELINTVTANERFCYLYCEGDYECGTCHENCSDRDECEYENSDYEILSIIDKYTKWNKTQPRPDPLPNVIKSVGGWFIFLSWIREEEEKSRKSI
jgi:hypothetical protein